MVAQADSTLVAIRKKVRRLTASPHTSQLSNDDIDMYINTYYSQDFPSSCKLDQLRTVYEFFTSPNVDTYSVDLNKYQGLRSPTYVEGRECGFYRDRSAFFNHWPKQTSRYTASLGDGGTLIFIWTLTGTPFTPGSITIGTVDAAGDPIKVTDDGDGNLLTADTTDIIGVVDYTAGSFSITFTTAPATGEDIIVWARPYIAARPLSILFWNDEITVRPIPDGIYRIEVEAFLTPTQFMATDGSPILNQWYQLLALGAAVKVLQDRQDMEGLQNVLPWLEEQRGLVLERQSAEQIGLRNNTIYSGECDSYSNNGNY